MILDALAGAQVSFDAGTSGTVTVPSGRVLTRIVVHASGLGATMTITPAGANQTGVASAAMPVIQDDWLHLGFLGELGGGSTVAFVGTDSYLLQYAKL